MKVNLFVLWFLMLFAQNQATAQTSYFFDGVDDFVSVNQTGNGVLGDFSVPEDWSLEIRFKLHMVPAWTGLMGKNGPPNHGWFIDIVPQPGNTTRLEAGFKGNSGFMKTNSNLISIDTWYTASLVYDSSNESYSFFLDGVQMGSTVNLGNFTPYNSPIAISKSIGYGGGESPIIVDFFRMWNNQQTQAQLDANKLVEVDCNATNLMLQYKFDYPSGSTVATDCSPNNFNGTINGAAVLPVELTKFNIRQIYTEAFLSWQTASEINNEGFEIERSPDGRNWENIGFEAGNGTTQETQDYEFIDERPLNGINYYRLKQMDFDGKFEYSDIQSVHFKNSQNPPIQVFPNPVQDGNLTVKLDQFDNQEITIQIYDLTGKIWLQRTSYDTTTELNIQDLTAGVYFLQINANGQTARQKIVIE